MRCPTCQYELWNLRAPTCPECGRGFTLDQWDFAHPDAPKDIRFACNACGTVLDGRLPGDLPLDCPACQAPIDRQAAMVVPRAGGEGEGVPLVADGTSVPKHLQQSATGVMLLATVAGLLVSLFNVGSPPAYDNAGLLLILLMVIAVGLFGLWPRRRERRLLVVASLCVLVFAAFMVSPNFYSNAHSKRVMGLRTASMARGITQGVLLYTQHRGVFPQDPQALIDRGYIPIEVYYPLENPPANLAWHSLADGWIMAGSFAIDWNPASWQADPPVVTIIAHPPARLARTPIGYGDTSVELLQATASQSIQRWNADRAAQGLAPIPAAALPANRTP